MTQPAITHENLRTPGKRRAPQRHRAMLAAATTSIPSPNYSSRGGTKVTGVVIHTTEGITDANNLGAFFAVPARQASSHVGIDDTKTVSYVDPQFEAWTLRNGNPWTDNAELCGMAEWPRDQWLQHPGMLRQAAEWVASRCKARGVPPKRLSVADLAAGRRSGYFCHWDYTRATGDGTHWDVGTGFPWDTFDGLVQAAYNGPPTPTPQEDDTVKYLAFRSDTDQGGTGAVALAAPGQWYGVPSMAYFTLLKARGLCGDWLNVPPNEFAYFRTVFLEPELNDEEIKAAVDALAASLKPAT